MVWSFISVLFLEAVNMACQVINQQAVIRR
jgi:hypothetical protein